MMARRQITLAGTGFEKYTKTSRRAQFLAEMDQVVAVDLESDPVAAGFVRGACAAGRQYHRGIPGFTGAERKTTAASQRGCSRWSSRHFSPRCRVMSYLPSVGNGAHED